jgi:hypothetical protein
MRDDPATIVVRRIDAAGEPVRFGKSSSVIAMRRSIIAREQTRGFEIFDRRDWR